MREDLLVMPYEGVTPKFSSAPLHAGAGAAVLGRATIGRNAWFGARSVVRADGHTVTIGDNFRLGAHGTVHIAHDVLATHIGDDVTAGVNAIIHACDVGNGCHIGRDVVILDGSRVADSVAIADGSIVFPRSALESGWLYQGQPARPVRKLEAGEIEAMHACARAAGDEVVGDVPPEPLIEAAGHLFVARTARVGGRVATGAEVGIWFGCDLDAGAHQIRIGENSNVQDNTIIRCIDRPVVIGRESTIGHNVVMTDCAVGDRSLVGMGAIVATGTIVEEDVLLAAGAHTGIGQVLESGWLYGGNPARQLSRLNDTRRDIIALTWPTYRIYARKFEAMQRESASRNHVGGWNDNRGEQR